jgi:hypothetical protein
MRWRQRKCKKYKEKGRWTKKMRSGKEANHKGEHKRENMKGRAQAKMITKTAKVRVLYWNVEGLRKKRRRILGLRETI